jgi:hypothetical protein
MQIRRIQLKIVKKISLMFIIILFSSIFFACSGQENPENPPVIDHENNNSNDDNNIDPPVIDHENNNSNDDNNIDPPVIDHENNNSNDDNNIDPPVVDERPILDTTPVVHEPVATGEKTKKTEEVTIDYSETSHGYVMVNYTGSNPKVRLLLTGVDNIKYTYILHGGYEVFPLTGGSGKYNIGVYENISGNSYLPVCNFDFDVQLESNFVPYLYPNQYVNYNADSKTVKMGASISNGAHTQLEIVEKVYNYTMKLLIYDDEKAANVKAGYIPNVDEILELKTGICFDYAAMMTTMLRTQKIPTMLQIGYAGKVYHAWISVYTEETGWINGIIQFDGKEWKRMDPTFADGSNESKDIMSYISNAGNYNLMYKH